MVVTGISIFAWVEGVFGLLWESDDVVPPLLTEEEPALGKVFLVLSKEEEETATDYFLCQMGARGGGCSLVWTVCWNT